MNASRRANGDFASPSGRAVKRDEFRKTSHEHPRPTGSTSEWRHAGCQHRSSLAQRLGVSQNTVFKWATHGDNPVNGYRLFKRTDLDKLLKKVARPVVPK
ncbi:MAG: helix-turn-helix domain-containing protein [Planctomycetaceae bacterium]